MFQSHIACPAAAPRLGGFSFGPIDAALIGRRLLPLLTVAALAGVVAGRPAELAGPSAPAMSVLQAATPQALGDAAETLRAALLRTPGVGAVAFDGLRQQGVAVAYAPRRLAGFGITPAQLAAALPVDGAASRPGYLMLRAEDGPASLQDAAALPVRAAGRVYRLGDVALVARAPLAMPIATMHVGGRPAVRVTAMATR